MHEIYTLENPFSIVFRKADTDESFKLVFDDTTGTVTFKTSNALYGKVESSHFDNSVTRTTLSSTFSQEEHVIITVEYLLFIDKLTKLFKLGGERVENFLTDILYLQNQVLSDNLINAFCILYGYDFQGVCKLLKEELIFTSTDIQFVDWLVNIKSVIVTPLGFRIEMGEGAFNIVQKDSSVVTKILVANKSSRKPINFFDALCKLEDIDGESLYNLCKTVYSYLLPISLASSLVKQYTVSKLDENTKQILSSQLARFTEFMIKLRFQEQ